MKWVCLPPRHADKRHISFLKYDLPFLQFPPHVWDALCITHFCISFFAHRGKGVQIPWLPVLYLNFPYPSLIYSFLLKSSATGFHPGIYFSTMATIANSGMKIIIPTIP